MKSNFCRKEGLIIQKACYLKGTSLLQIANWIFKLNFNGINENFSGIFRYLRPRG